MYPWYKGYIADIKLSNDDIRGIQALYPSKHCFNTDEMMNSNFLRNIEGHIICSIDHILDFQRTESQIFEPEFVVTIKLIKL